MQKAPSLPPPPPSYAPIYAARPYNTWAIVSVSFGASTILGTWCLGGLVAVITGHVARNQIKKSGEAGDGLALAGLIAGYISIALFSLLIFVYVAFVAFIFAFAATHPGPSPTPVGGG